MTLTLILIGVLLAWAIFFGVRLVQKRSRRAHLLQTPLPPEWEKILEKRYDLYRRLPDDVRERLAGLIHVFIEEKQFEACGDLEEITDEIRVLVAAQACLLLVGIANQNFFPRLQSILIYPAAYHDRRRRTFHLTPDLDDHHVRLGESWDSGSVVLSWKSVRAGANHDDDGMNVVYHEFAHQLDQVDGSADGAPSLPHSGNYSEWSRVFSREYEALVADAKSPRANPLLDTYGATNPAEFFAVATESFFEKPKKLKSRHPELYDQLVGYFGIDPTSWE